MAVSLAASTKLNVTQTSKVNLRHRGYRGFPYSKPWFWVCWRPLYVSTRTLTAVSHQSSCVVDMWASISVPQSSQDAPDKQEEITFKFEKGRCTEINGKAVTPLQAGNQGI